MEIHSLQQQTKRIALIDSLRGLALLGIFLVNITFFTTSLQAISLGVELWSGGYNDILLTLRSLFVESKFILIFSFLFGFGMILLQESSIAKGRAFAPIYVRRLLALLVIGVIHGIFIWFGDILTHYALLGFFLLFFQRAKPRTILIWSLILLLIVPVLFTASALFPSGESSIFQPFSPEEAYQVGLFYQEKDAQIYAEGTFTQITLQRVQDYIASFFNMIIFYPQILGMFLLGAYFCKKRVLQEPLVNRSLLVTLILLGVTVGFGLQLILIGMNETASLFEIISIFVGAPLLSLAYIGLFVFAYQQKVLQRVFQQFSYVGKMAFTNYLLQSIICGFIFYSYGLGWYGTVEPVWQMSLVLVIFFVQVVFSKLWLKYFAIGPFEFIWRTITYWGNPVKKGERIKVEA